MSFSPSPSWLTSLKKRLKKPPVLFLDFDGTLVPIAQRPGQVQIDSSIRRLVRFLSYRMPVVVISGRGLKDIRQKIRLDHIFYVGNHGLEMDGPSFHYEMKDALHWKKFVKQLVGKLEKDLSGISGIFVEDKGYSISIHYRLTPSQYRRKAARLFKTLIQPYLEAGRVRLTQGKAVWEVRPPIEWNKGTAVLFLLKLPQLKGRWPIYIGDDQTDQDAMRMIKRSGFGIAVGPPHKKGAGHASLSHPGDVHRFLMWLVREVSEGMIPLKGVSREP